MILHGCVIAHVLLHGPCMGPRDILASTMCVN